MNDSFDGITTALDAVRAAAGGRSVGALTAGELIAVNEAFGALHRHVDAAHARVASEIARQSRSELGRDSLAKKQGFRSAATMVSTITGTTVGEAIRLIAVGEATTPRMALSGEAAPAKHPFVGDAVDAARIGIQAASAIIAMLDRVALRADRASAERMEQRLAQQAPGLSMDQLHKLILRAEAYLDPDGIVPREDQLRGDCSARIREEATGMIVLTARLDPETGAPVKAALEGMVTGMLHRRDRAAKADAEEGLADMADRRSIAQMRADALADLCRHALGCSDVPTLANTTVVVRVSLADLESGVGSATIDGVAMPVSAATARRMAADAEVIPCVLGGDSEILDWGRAKRLFTSAQKLALAERDGGCAFCGLPPSMAVGHHIQWWALHGGRTDLGNGILLCTSCHHRIHDDGWDIRIDGVGTRAKVWFIPPPWLDAARTPRLGGRARYDLAA